MRRFASFAFVAMVLGACGSATPASTSSPSPAATIAPAAPPTAATSSAPVGPAASQSFKVGSWPPEWQLRICSARAQMLREDARAGGTPGEDAGTQAIADLKKTTINWEPGADMRALLGKAAFILLDAAPRGGNAMADVPPAIKAFETAYADLRAATGFECPG